jgi:SAM-dependent methyltransferase
VTVAAVAHRNNAQAIADAAALGYLRADALTLDMTYGNGTWWKLWWPDRLVAIGRDLAAQFGALPFHAASFDGVAFDPPYKLVGTPALGDFDVRYGLDRGYVSRQDRHATIRAGISEAVRVLRPGGVLLVKCMAQVCSGAKRWQDREFSDRAEARGCQLVDRLWNLGGSRAQPHGRRQVHSHGEPSVLLVFRKQAGPVG